ncbi:hypothetical protein C0J52_14907 [Blattella germanica]|nr:hypothetical protein C0J52_14907 [Blattella germanica]
MLWSSRQLPGNQIRMEHVKCRLVIFAVAVCLTVMTLTDAASNTECIKVSHTCIHKDECCTGCCVEGKCVEFSDSCNVAQSPCAVHSCPSGKKCYLQQVQCIQAPCPPVPACKDEDYDDYN